MVSAVWCRISTSQASLSSFDMILLNHVSFERPISAYHNRQTNVIEPIRLKIDVNTSGVTVSSIEDNESVINSNCETYSHKEEFLSFEKANLKAIKDTMIDELKPC